MPYSHEDDDEFSSADDDQDSSYAASEASLNFSPTSSFSPLTPTSLHFPLSTPSLSLSTIQHSSSSASGRQVSESSSSQTLGRKATDHSSASSIQHPPRSSIPPGGVLPASILEQGFSKEGMPRRPMNGFMIFSRWKRTQLRGKQQELKTGEISSLLSAEWKTIDKASKDFYLGQAIDLKNAFDARYPSYKYVRRPNGTRKKGSRGGKTYIPRVRAKQQALLDAQQGSSNSSALGLGGMSNESEPTRWVGDEEEGDGRQGLVEQSRTVNNQVQQQQPRRVGIPSSSLGRAPNGSSNDRIARRTISQPYLTPSEFYRIPHPVQRSPSFVASPSNIHDSAAPRRLITIPSIPSLKQRFSSVPSASSYLPSTGDFEQSRGLVEMRSQASTRPSFAHPPSYPSTPMSSTFTPSSESQVYSSQSSPYVHPTSSFAKYRSLDQEQPLGDLVQGWIPPPPIRTVGLGFGIQVEGKMELGMRSGLNCQEDGSQRTRTERRGREGGTSSARRVEEYHQSPQQPRWTPAPLQSPFLSPAAGSSSFSTGSAHLPHFFGQTHSLAYNDVPPPTDLFIPSLSPYDHSYPQHQKDSSFNYPSQPTPFQPSVGEQDIGRDQYNYPPPPSNHPSLFSSYPFPQPPISPEYHHPASFTSYRSNPVLLGSEAHGDALWTGGSNSPNGIEDLKPQGGFA